MQAMAWVMTATRMKTSTMRKTTKHRVGTINSDQRQPQSKNKPSHSTGSKISREQMQEMLSNQRRKKLT